MRAAPGCLLALVLSVLLPLQAQAKKPHTKKPVPVSAAAVAEVAETGPAGIADDFHELLREGKRAQVLALLTEDAVIFETGYAGQSRDDYAQSHVSDDADFARVTDYHVLRRQVLQDGNVAWVLTQAAVQGIFGDQNVDLEQTETMILRHTAGGWRISHIHWSAHSRAQQQEEASPAPAATPTPESAAPAAQSPSVATPVVAEPPPDPQPLAAPAVPSAPIEEPVSAPPASPAVPEPGKTPD